MEDDDEGCRGLKGLPNLGNTCYINSALQALSHIKPLRLYFIQTYFRRLRLQWDNSIDSLFSRFITSMWSNRHGEASNNPTETMAVLRALVSFTWKRYTFFNPGDQHDSQEFLQCLLADLHDSLKYPYDPEACFQNPTDGQSEPLDGYKNIMETLNELSKKLLQGKNGCSDYWDKIDQFIRLANDLAEYRLNNWNDHGDDNGVLKVDPYIGTETDTEKIKFRSIISDLFVGELENTILCANCGKTSVLTETFMSLSIPIGAIDRAIQSKILQNSTNFPSVHRSVSFKSSSPSSSSSSGQMTEPEPVDETPILSTQPDPSDEQANSLMLRSYRFAMEAFRYYYQYMWSWFDWFMSMLSTSSVDLIDCLETFFNPELLENENRYHCNNCKKLCNGIKCIRIKRLPEILVVHLNRYQNVNSMVRKITSQLNFPLVDFSLSSFLSESSNSGQNSVYDLVAVICHNGSQVTNGHYICYALNDLKMEWYEFDDIHVSFVDSDRIMSMASSAYILFYQRSNIDSLADRTVEVVSDLERRWISQCQDFKFLERLNFNLDYYYFSRPSNITVKDEVFINLKSFPISKYWSDSFLSLPDPGHIDNTDIFCPHALIRPTEYLFFNKLSVSVIEPVGQFLWSIYGGGPIFHSNRSYPVCPRCTLALDLLDQRRRNEYQTFTALQNAPGSMFRKFKFEKGQVSITFETDDHHCQESRLELSSSQRDNKDLATTDQSDDDDNEDEDDPDSSKMKIVEISSNNEEQETTLFYVISAQWMIKWFSFVMIRYDSATVTSRDRQLASLLEQIMKKREVLADMSGDNKRPYDHIYRKPLIRPGDPRIIHPPLVSVLRSISNTMTKNQCPADSEEVIKQVDLGLHTVRPPGPIDNWSFFGIKQKILSENRARNKERSSLKTIDDVVDHGELCSLFAEMLSGETGLTDKEKKNQCDYKFKFHPRMGGGHEENNCCVFYFMVPEFWRFFHEIYGGGPTITFNCSLNRYEAHVTSQDVKYFMQNHYKPSSKDSETGTGDTELPVESPIANHIHHAGDDSGSNTTDHILRYRHNANLPNESDEI